MTRTDKTATRAQAEVDTAQRGMDRLLKTKGTLTKELTEVDDELVYATLRLEHALAHPALTASTASGATTAPVIDPADPLGTGAA